MVNNVVQVVSSLSQWQPESVMAKTSSRLILSDCVYSKLDYDFFFFFLLSVIESFEKVIALYAQQLPLNGSINFILPSLTLLAESVSF